MKKLALAFALVLIFAVPVMAAPVGQSNYGCGLGAVVFKDGGANDSTLMQLVATFLNGLCGNGTFGITTGTSDCYQPKGFVSNEKLNEFAYKNLDDLARDIAAGQGETLTVIAVLLDVPKESRQDFNGKLQMSFSEIFPTPTVEVAHVVDTITKIATQG